MNDEPITILLVEDEPAHVEIVRRNFETIGIAHTLKHVPDGESALDYLYRNDSFRDPASSPRPGLILLDLRLPKVDGLQVLKTIKNDSALNSIPIVILSTSASENDITMAYANGANSYVVKPADFKQFGELLDSIGTYWMTWNHHSRK
ncbi:MAG: response regulator [Geobacteraceae bacterium]|nr:response regulator [Geobacteraceae bacterium]